MEAETEANEKEEEKKKRDNDDDTDDNKAKTMTISLLDNQFTKTKHKIKKYTKIWATYQLRQKIRG